MLPSFVECCVDPYLLTLLPTIKYLQTAGVDRFMKNISSVKKIVEKRKKIVHDYYSVETLTACHNLPQLPLKDITTHRVQILK
jgi:hypothetical protein